MTTNLHPMSINTNKSGKIMTTIKKRMNLLSPRKLIDQMYILQALPTESVLKNSSSKIMFLPEETNHLNMAINIKTSLKKTFTINTVENTRLRTEHKKEEIAKEIQILLIKSTVSMF